MSGLPKHETLGEQIERHMENKRIGDEMATCWDEAYAAGLETAAQWCGQENLEGDPDDLYTGRKQRAEAIRALKEKPVL